MMVMPGNNGKSIVHYWSGRFPGKIGWLIGPSAIAKTKLRKWLPFALDNDAFAAWVNKTPWSEDAWLKLFNAIKRSGLKPLWALVPDVVADREKTLEKWDRYSPTVERFGWSKAFAAQDGMTPGDVPKSADVVFVGGTTEWKWRSLRVWCSNFPRVHVGRVNSIEKLWICEELGVESVDGTGWFRDGDGNGKADMLERWMEGERQSPTFQFHRELAEV